jgi:hypothetical protein
VCGRLGWRCDSLSVLHTHRRRLCFFLSLCLSLSLCSSLSHTLAHTHTHTHDCLSLTLTLTLTLTHTRNTGVRETGAVRRRRAAYARGLTYGDSFLLVNGGEGDTFVLAVGGVKGGVPRLRGAVRRVCCQGTRSKPSKISQVCARLGWCDAAALRVLEA